MFNRKPKSHRIAFENCAVRAVSKNLEARQIEMICPKYPNGFTFDSTIMGKHYEDQRETLALKLGCLVCPYRNDELPHGESATEAIHRIGNQQAIDEMNRLAGQPSYEPPLPPKES